LVELEFFEQNSISILVANEAEGVELRA